MALSVTSDRVLQGNGGELWVNGKKMAEVYSMEAQIEIQNVDVPLCGSKNGKAKKFTGWEGTGNIKFNKVSSAFAKQQAEAVKNGKPLFCTIISKLADPSAAKYGHERVELLNCQFNTITLTNWEAGQVIQNEVPFTFENFNFLNIITD